MWATPCPTSPLILLAASRKKPMAKATSPSMRMTRTIALLSRGPLVLHRARTTAYAYLTTDNSLPTLITEPNRTTSFTHDANGNVLTRTVTDTSVDAECLAHLDLHVQRLRPRADRRRPAHGRQRRHDLHLLHLHDRLPVRPAEHDHQCARPRRRPTTRTTRTASRRRSRTRTAS